MPLEAASLAGSGRCRACGGAVSAKPGAARPLATPCPRCGYINILDEGEIVLPLAVVGGEHLTEAATTTEIVAVLAGHAARNLDKARAVIAAELPAATAFLLTSMEERERRLTLLLGAPDYRTGVDGVTFNLATQLLYLLLCEQGGPDLRLLAGEAPAHAHLGGTLWPLLDGAAFLPRLFAQVETGQGVFSVRGADLILAKTAEHTLIQEWTTNRQHWEHHVAAKPELAVAAPGFIEAQRLVLGFAAEDLLALLGNDFARLSELLRVARRGALRLTVTEGAPPELQRMLDAMTLTPDRLRRFSTPFYFDLGFARAGGTAAAVPAAAFGVNWTAYYPLYRATAANGREIVMATRSPVDFAFANMEGARGNMFAQLLATTPKGSESRSRIGELGREMSARLEAAIADLARAAGYTAAAGVESLSGARLPCGEIDALAVRTDGGVTRIVVAEAKDIDVPLQKPGAMAQARATIAKGDAQLARKADWVAAHWRRVAGALGAPTGSTAQVFPMLVTRRFIPPGLGPAPAVFLGTVPGALERLAAGRYEAAEGSAPFMVIEGAP